MLQKNERSKNTVILAIVYYATVQYDYNCFKNKSAFNLLQYDTINHKSDS